MIVALATGTAAAVGGEAAIAASSSTTHTLSFTSRTTSMTQFDPRFVSADNDVKGGHVIGNDVLSAKVTYTKKTYAINGGLAIALKGGEIYATITGNPGSSTLPASSRAAPASTAKSAAL